jgi:hypothetical protein
MARMETRGQRDHVRAAPGWRFVIGALIVAVIAVALSLAMGVPVPPDAEMFQIP